jgi:hypothetical protein
MPHSGVDAPHGGSPDASAGGGWRGRRGQAAEIPRHRWQQSRSTDKLPARTNRGRIATAVWLALGLGLSGWFVWMLLLTPKQTPVIALSASAYEWPFSPNAWAAEDLDGLQQLDDQTLQIVGAGAPCRTKEQTLHHLERHLQALSRPDRHDQTVVIHVSMHGAVDGSGAPCLVPPGASPRNSDTWLPVADLLAAIRDSDLPDSLNKLLILDCSRMRSNWNLGLLDNGFSDRLPEVVARADVPNLAVLNSAGPGQVGWASADLRGSVFGHYLRLGLAGAADAPEEGGDGDRRVSLHELHHYLRHHVGRWAVQNRGERQQPMLLPVHAPDFHVAWSLRTRRPPAEPGGTAPSPNADAVPTDLESLWREYERLAALRPERFDPVAWRDYQHRLLWLEQTVTAGEAYRAAMLRARHELPRLANKIEEQATGDWNQGSGVRNQRSGGGPTAGRRSPVTGDRSLTGHTLPLAEFLGTLEPAVAADLRAMLAQFRQSPSRESLTEALDSIDRRAGEDRPATTLDTLDEVHFLRLLRRPPASLRLGEPQMLRRILAIRELAEAAAVPADERTHLWIRGHLDAGDRARRTAEDRFFAGDANVGSLCDEAEKQYAEARTRAEAVAKALAVRDRVWAELPWLAQWLADPRASFVVRPSVRTSDDTDSGAPVSDALLSDDESDRTLLRLVQDAHDLNHLLARPPAVEHGAPSEDLPFAGRVEEVEQQYRQLRRLYDEQCTRLLEERTPSVETLRGLEAVLSVPLLPGRNADAGLPAAQQRARLRAAHAEIASALHSGLAGAPAGPRRPSTDRLDSENGTADGEDVERIMVRWEEHPALAILSPHVLRRRAEADGEAGGLPNGTDAAHAPVTSAAVKGQRIRELLAGIATAVHESVLREPATDDPAAASRDGWGRGERLVRSAAAFAFRPPEDDPIRHLRQLDVQWLLLWHCARALDDFRGPADAEERPFFETAAAGLLQTARETLAPDRYVSRRVAELNEQIARRSRAAREGLKLDAEDLVLIDPDAEVAAEVRAAGDAEIGRWLPTGEVALFLGDARGALDGTLRAFAMPSNDDAKRSIELNYALRGADLAGRGPQMDAVAWFRGNTFATPFVLNPAGGARVEVLVPGEQIRTVYEGSVVYLEDPREIDTYQETVRRLLHTALGLLRDTVGLAVENNRGGGARNARSARHVGEPDPRRPRHVDDPLPAIKPTWHRSGGLREGNKSNAPCTAESTSGRQ